MPRGINRGTVTKPGHKLLIKLLFGMCFYVCKSALLFWVLLVILVTSATQISISFFFFQAIASIMVIYLFIIIIMAIRVLCVFPVFYRRNNVTRSKLAAFYRATVVIGAAKADEYFPSLPLMVDFPLR